MPSPPAILIVEDDPGVRRMLETALRDAGWPILTAGSGIAALAAVVKYDGPIALAIVDLVMPELGGLDVANQLAMDRPSTKVLYISGIRSVAMDSILSRAPEMLLQKPFTVRELLARVQMILAY